MTPEIRHLLDKWRKEADDIEADGDICCALTRRHDADALEAALLALPVDLPPPEARPKGFSEWWVCFRCWIAYHVPTTGFYGTCQGCGHDTQRWPANPLDTLLLRDRAPAVPPPVSADLPPGEAPPQVCLCEIDRHDFNCPVHNDLSRVDQSPIQDRQELPRESNRKAPND